MQTGHRTEVLRPGLFAGRSAIVTGAGTGIGKAVAIRLAGLGMKVAGLGRRREKLEETQREISATGGSFALHPCDVRDGAAVEGAIARIGGADGIDLLVNNAGGQFFAPATAISRKGWDAVIDLNLTSVFVVTKAAYPFLRERRGAVVNLSLSGVERGSMGLAHSIAARAGVLGLTRTLALEWASDGIRLNCIGPGTVITDALSGEAAGPMVEGLVAATPMGRPTDAAEVAELVAFLASPAAALVSGQLIHIDGVAHLGAGLHLYDG